MAATSKSADSASAINQKVLLNCSFTELLAVNFQIDSSLLLEYVPKGLELDFYNSETYVSLIGMVVRKVGLFGLPRSFNELSLRFYVRRKTKDGFRKGTCFLRNYVSSSTGAWILGNHFNRKFSKLKIKNKNTGFRGEGVPQVDFQWNVGDHANRLRVRARNPIKNDGPDTKVGFIISHSNHYESAGGQTLEYRTKRPNWTVWDAAQANFTCDVKNLFGHEFVKPLARRPASVFVTAGSDVTIYKPTEI